MFLKTLSGRFLMLAVVFVMVAEVFIFVPSVARFREDYLRTRLERAQIASLAVLASSDQRVEDDLRRELLANAEVLNVVLRRDDVRELVLASPMTRPVSATYDLRDRRAWVLIGDALAQIGDAEPRVIRVIGVPTQDAGLLIEVTIETGPLRAAMIDYGWRILQLSLLISAIVALLLFVAVQRSIVAPIARLVRQMRHYQQEPQDSARIIVPQSSIRELALAENALQSLQTDLSTALRQSERLAALGRAVAKISHDLRNMLTVAQLLGDRLEASDDPTVKRTAPKLLASLDRAVNLCETTLAFGRAEEPKPTPASFRLGPLVEEVLENERLQLGAADVTLEAEIAPDMRVLADREQLYRVLSNLVRNAAQAILGAKRPGGVQVRAEATPEGDRIEITDTGPGLPARAREHLFQPFRGGARKGGTGLGLAIAAELVRGHGGALVLEESTEAGTRFAILLPRQPFGEA